MTASTTDHNPFMLEIPRKTIRSSEFNINQENMIFLSSVEWSSLCRRQIDDHEKRPPESILKKILDDPI